MQKRKISLIILIKFDCIGIGIINQDLKGVLSRYCDIFFIWL